MDGFSGFVAIAMCVAATFMMLYIALDATKKSPIKD
jgi:hypothetical protein